MQKHPARLSIVCEAAPKKKADSAVKRARQADKRRIYNKARKSEIKTRMKKVLLFPFCLGAVKCLLFSSSSLSCLAKLYEPSVDKNL